jgi:soluble lytic murein transglycosylase-like protein
MKRLLTYSLMLALLVGPILLWAAMSGPFSVVAALAWNAGAGATAEPSPTPTLAASGTLAAFGLSGPVTCRSAEPPTSSPYLAVARADAQKYKLDTLAFEWKIWQESGYQINVESKAGAIGIAQFMPETARAMGIDPRDPQQALDASARLDAGHITTYAARARQLAGHYGGSAARYGYALALAAYNAGPGALESAWRGAYAGGWSASPWAWLARMAGETQRYVPDILACSTR